MQTAKSLMAMAVALVLAVAGTAGTALAGKPTIMKGCRACHSPKPNVVRGKLVSHSPKFRSIQVDVGPLVWIIKYDVNMKLRGAKTLEEVKKGKEMSVTFTGTQKDPVAAEVSIKPPFKLPEEKLVSVEEMKALVARGTEKGGYLLIDSRPPDAFASGHIPGALSLPYPKLNKMREKALPAAKDTRIIFYCGGFA